MTHNGTQPAATAPLARRTNGLSPVAPDPGRLVLVTGGAGYIGSVLCQRLLDRGYRVRILDRLYWGRGPIGAILDGVELVEADVRDMPATALDGVDAVIHLAGLSNDPTAEYDPEANWQMNAVATEALGRNCVDREVANPAERGTPAHGDRRPPRPGNACSRSAAPRTAWSATASAPTTSSTAPTRTATAGVTAGAGAAPTSIARASSRSTCTTPRPASRCGTPRSTRAWTVPTARRPPSASTRRSRRSSPSIPG